MITIRIQGPTEEGHCRFVALRNGTEIEMSDLFLSHKDAVDAAVAKYKIKRRVTVLVSVELEDATFDADKLADMIGARASTIQGVNAMGTDTQVYSDAMKRLEDEDLKGLEGFVNARVQSP